MNVSDIWMRLECINHLKDRPEFAAIHQKMREELMEIQASLLKPQAKPQAAAPASVPKAIPATPEAETPSNGERRV